MTTQCEPTGRSRPGLEQRMVEAEAGASAAPLQVTDASDEIQKEAGGTPVHSPDITNGPGAAGADSCRHRSRRTRER